MPDTDDAFQNWLLQIIGRKLLDVRALIFSFNGEEDFDSPQKLSLIFEGLSIGNLSCATDGSSIKHDGNPVVGRDLGKYGKEIAKNISGFPPWNDFIGKTVTKVELLYSNREGSTMGIFFEFNNSMTIMIANIGDEIAVYKTLPKLIENEEQISLLPVTQQSQGGE